VTSPVRPDSKSHDQWSKLSMPSVFGMEHVNAKEHKNKIFDSRSADDTLNFNHSSQQNMGGVEFWDDFFGQYHKKSTPNTEILSKEDCIEQMTK